MSSLRGEHMFCRNSRNGVVFRIGFVIVAGVLVAAASGCGGGSSSGTGANSGGATIKLGVIANSHDLKVVQAGAEAAIADINATGGVHGHPLELDVCDNQLKASAAAACARRFISESVVATVGDESSYGSDTNSLLANAKIAGIGTN